MQTAYVPRTVALITWRVLLLRAKHLFVAAIGRRSPRRAAARRPRERERYSRRAQAQLTRRGSGFFPAASCCGHHVTGSGPVGACPKQRRQPAVPAPGARQEVVAQFALGPRNWAAPALFLFVGAALYRS